MMQSLDHHISWHSVHVVRDVSVSAVVQEQFTGLVRALSRRLEERRFILVIMGVSVGAMSEQNLQGIHVQGCQTYGQNMPNTAKFNAKYANSS